MKQLLAASVLALLASASAQQPASAWSHFKFGIGLNIECSRGDNNSCWGMHHSGPLPGPAYGGYGGYGTFAMAPPFAPMAPHGPDAPYAPGAAPSYAPGQAAPLAPGDFTPPPPTLYDGHTALVYPSYYPNGPPGARSQPASYFYPASYQPQSYPSSYYPMSYGYYNYFP